jgi:GMP synthase-like glutamine amidotransferase
LLAAALADGLPVLGICRGMQLLNVARGGTLRQHLAAGAGHRPAPGTFGSHQVRLAPGSRLAAILRPGGGPAGLTLNVPTAHHQGIARLGDGLVPAAWAEDGLIEAVELAPGPGQHPFMLAVQWHPEASQDRRLVSALVAAAADGGAAGPWRGRAGPRPARPRIVTYGNSGAFTLTSVTTTPAVEVHDLVKRYGRITAVNGLSLCADRGRVTAVLGPTGRERPARWRYARATAALTRARCQCSA